MHTLFHRRKTRRDEGGTRTRISLANTTPTRPPPSAALASSSSPSDMQDAERVLNVFVLKWRFCNRHGKSVLYGNQKVSVAVEYDRSVTGTHHRPYILFTTDLQPFMTRF